MNRHREKAREVENMKRIVIGGNNVQDRSEGKKVNSQLCQLYIPSLIKQNADHIIPHFDSDKFDFALDGNAIPVMGLGKENNWN